MHEKEKNKLMRKEQKWCLEQSSKQNRQNVNVLPAREAVIEQTVGH
jgi:hypothetical protein